MMQRKYGSSDVGDKNGRFGLHPILVGFFYRTIVTNIYVSKHAFFRLFWILFWLFGIIYTGYAVYQDTNHYLDYPSMILRKEESLGTL